MLSEDLENVYNSIVQSELKYTFSNSISCLKFEINLFVILVLYLYFHCFFKIAFQKTRFLEGVTLRDHETCLREQTSKFLKDKIHSAAIRSRR